jgi:HEAT repeat protein
MRAFSTSLMLLALGAVLLAPAATAQERIPAVPLPREKDGVRMKPPPGGERKVAPEKEPREETAKPGDPFEASVQALSTWPDNAAREAAAGLALYGPEAEARLIDALKTAPPSLSAGICFVLGEIGGDASVAAVQAVAARPTMADQLDIVFEALGKLDGANAARRILPFLRHPKRPARESAEKWLGDHLDPALGKRLIAFLDDPSRGARLSAIHLLEKSDPSLAVQRAFDLLSDKAPEVARAAAEILSGRSGKAEIERLNQIAGREDTRATAYALLSLALLRDRAAILPYDLEIVPQLLGGAGIRSANKLQRAAASVVLADIGYSWEVAEVDAVLDGEVINVLLDTLGGPSYFTDFSSFAETARDRFGLLTGIQDRRPVPLLWAWWKEEQEGFVARRALRTMDPTALGAFRIRARSSVEPAMPTTLFSTLTSDAIGPDALGIGFVFLLPEDAVELAGLVSRELLPLPDSGVVSLQNFPAQGETILGPDLLINVSLGKRSRTITGYRGSSPEGALVVLRRLKELRSQYGWQRYWDRSTWPSYEEFIATQAPFFTSSTDPEFRKRRLKDLIISSLDDLVTEIERTTAAEELVRLAPVLTDSDAYKLAILLETADSVTPYVERITEALIAAEKPLVLPVLASWFERQPGPRGRELFVRVLASFGPAELRHASEAESVYLRRAAMRAAPEILAGTELVALLMVGVSDESASVRQESLLTFGRSGLDEAMPVLSAGLADPNSEVIYAAIEAMGTLARPECVSVLSLELLKDDKARQVAAVKALCATRLPEALVPILRVIEKDESPLLRGVAAREVVGFGEKALGGVSSIAMNASGRPEVRALAIEALVRIGGEHVSVVLEALLGDPNDGVADAAAYALAAQARKDAAPRLLDALENDRNPVRAIAALELLSCQSFPTARAEELPAIYRGWWTEHESEPASTWFASALTARGYEGPAIEVLSNGRPTMDAVPALTNALGDGDWFIRANANLWLRRITLEDLGEVSRFTSPEDVRAVQARWRVWWEAR